MMGMTDIQSPVPAPHILAIIPEIAPQGLEYPRDRRIYVWNSSEMRDRRRDKTMQLSPVIDAAGLKVESGRFEGGGPFERFGREA